MTKYSKHLAIAIFTWIMIALVCTFLSILMVGCKSIQYVPVETIRTEIKNIHDTVRINDSIKNEMQTVIREADSTEIERLNKEYGFKLDKAQRTILILQKELEHSSHNQSEIRDSIVYRDKEVQVPYPVEKKLTKWQQIKLDIGGYTMIVLIVLLIIGFLWLFLRRTGKRSC